ncbi:helix-turn-helix domain-containing protein [Pedobacter sp.]|uniref:helix-turn-helix domain-containing protein n=1 Tax=Pedobacter sp. TaxID=1411316 RepID=UPI0039C92C2D
MLKEHLTLLNNKIIHFQQGHIPSDLVVLKKLFDLLEIHFRGIRQPSFYSEALKVTLSNLNYLTRQHFNCTVYELMQGRIHEEAEKLLKYSTLTIKEITFELGMTDPSYFCKCFRKITGLSPKRFREGVC